MILVYVSCSNEKEAGEIGRKLVEEKLAVCANIVPEINSIYMEDGKVETSHESLLLLKTNSDYEKVRDRIAELHSYKIPAIACFEIQINKKYLDWSKSI